MLRLFQSRCAGFVFRRSTPFALPCGSLRWLRSAGSALGGSAAEKKSTYLTPWSERSGDFRRGLRPSVWLNYLKNARDFAPLAPLRWLSSPYPFLRVAQKSGISLLANVRARGSRGFHAGKPSLPTACRKPGFRAAFQGDFRRTGPGGCDQNLSETKNDGNMQFLSFFFDLQRFIACMPGKFWYNLSIL